MRQLEQRQHQATDKAWQAYSQGKITEDQAIERWAKSIEAMDQQLAKLGYTIK